MSDSEISPAALKNDMVSLKGDLTEVKSSINRIADALTKLAILEDRQLAATAVMQKTLDRLEVLEDRQHTTELRFATGMVSQERILGVEAKVGELATKINVYETSGKAVTGAAKVFWMIFGGFISGTVTLWLMRAA